jgi:O-acetyl-ADP-ribose deacetylase (regulator of RNase III)
METFLSNVKIITKTGSITDEEVDAITNAANSRLIMGGGVAGAIKRIGGAIIEQEAIKYAPIPIGKAVDTTAGKLKAKFVIHAPTMQTPGPTTKENVYKATKAALTRADEIGARSIAIPGMGTGIGAVPIDEAANAMIQAVKEHITSGTKLKKIILIDLDPSIKEMWDMLLSEMV